MRQLVETAISSGRSSQSPQTGFVHYCYEMRDEASHDTIPVYENVLFALALLRTRNSTSVKEAKDLLEKILPYEVEGNFPKYLHEYPNCTDHFASAKLLVPFYWILKRFFLVLGAEFRQRLTTVAESLLQHSVKHHKEKPAPFHIAIKIAAAQKSFGELWQQSALEHEGDSFLEQLRKQSEAEDFGVWFSPQYIADTLAALMMVYSPLSESPWSVFWEYVSQTYYRKGFCYIGPAVQVRQWGLEPQVTSYDLLMGGIVNDYPYRSFIDHPNQLHAAIVFPDTCPWKEPVSPISVEGSVANHRWNVFHSDHYAFSVLQKKSILDPAMQKGFHVFQLAWGDVNNTHTLVCQGEGATYVDYALQNNRIEFEFFLGDIPDFDKKESQKEIAFYCDQSEITEILVSGQKATTFQCGETVTIQSSKIKIELVFELIEGDGRFFGHIMPGNRPAQSNLKGVNRFQTFDWSIFLRTVKRYTPCKIKVALKIEPVKTSL